MTIIDTFKASVCFCKIRAVKKAVDKKTFPEQSVSFKLASLHILQDAQQQKYMEANFTAHGPWHGFTIFLNFKENDLFGELNYLMCDQAPGSIVAECIKTETGYFIYGQMQTLGEKVKEGFIIIAENNQLLVDEKGLISLKGEYPDNDIDNDLDELDDDAEDEYTDIVKQFVRLRGEERFIACQSYAIYILCRLGYKVSFQNSKWLHSILIDQNGKEQEVFVLPSLSNRTWAPKVEYIKKSAKYILMDIHPSMPLPDVYIFKGSQLIKKLMGFPIIFAKDPKMIALRNIWDLLLDSSIPF